ncbi:unnamed protein product [marine sediment metagenome]|uniref:Uncharacterized protein n=1 Tax=marine sediment metagenome TaxID=412755 RepID=X1V5K0_9ZZZZ
MSLKTAFLQQASKYGKLVRPPNQEADDLICQEICPGCRGKLRWHYPEGVYGRVFFVCDTCDRWFFVIGIHGSWEVIREALKRIEEGNQGK